MLLASTVWVYGAASGPGRAGRGRAGGPAPGRARVRGHQARAPSCWCTATGRCTASTSRSSGTASRTGRGCGRSWWWPGSSGPRWTAGRSPSPEPGTSSGTTCTWPTWPTRTCGRWPRPPPTRRWPWKAVTPVSVREIADTVREPGPRRAGRVRARPHRRLPGGQRVQRAGQGAARLGPGHPVRRGCAPVPGVAGDGARLPRRAIAAVRVARAWGTTCSPRPARTRWPAGAGAPRRWTPCGCSARAAAPRARRCSASMLAVPGVYDALHFAALRTGAWPALLADAAARRQVVPRLRGPSGRAARRTWSSRCSPPAASAASALADRYPAQTHVVFCTDVTPHRLWVHPDVDAVPGHLGGGRGGRAAVPARGAGRRSCRSPVRAAFYTPPSQGQARARLGVPRHRPLRAADVRRLGPRAGGQGRRRRWPTAGRAGAGGGRA